MLDDILGGLGDVLNSVLQTILYNTIYKLLYYIAYALCWILDLLYKMFEVFGGLIKVRYDGTKDYLINIFFSTDIVSNAYWGMALIGIALTFAFTIVSVIRKSFDSNQKIQNSMGTILTRGGKAVLIILCLSAIMTGTLNATNVLMQRVDYLFTNASIIDDKQSIQYTDEQFAAMARVYNTIGNYSMNPSCESRYNINSCYNDIRADMNYLYDEGVFEFYYSTKDEQGNQIATWQSRLQAIANSADLDKDLKMDVYNEGVAKAITAAMNELRTNGSFLPLENYERTYNGAEYVSLDRIVFLMGSMRAANNSYYNENPSLNDPVRGPYFNGEKSIYDADSVYSDFDIGITAFDYLIVYIAAVMLIWDIAVVILTCIARIFNLMLLYVTAPGFIAAMPLDDGGKFKQWTLAFIVQSLGVFATVISMRLFILFLPIVANADLVLFDNVLLNLMAKLMLILGAGEAVKRSNGMITGILADSAGWQSIMAGDMGATGRGAANAVKGFMAGAASKTGSGLWGGTKAVGRGANALGEKIFGGRDNRLPNWVGGMDDGSGDSGGGGSGGAASDPARADRSGAGADAGPAGGPQGGPGDAPAGGPQGGPAGGPGGGPAGGPGGGPAGGPQGGPAAEPQMADRGSAAPGGGAGPGGANPADAGGNGPGANLGASQDNAKMPPPQR